MTARLGIIGSGQLALYLTQAAQKLDSQVAVLAEPGDAPALEVADRPFQSSLDNMAAVDEFLANCDVVTFDKESVPDQLLPHLIAAQGAFDDLYRKASGQAA